MTLFLIEGNMNSGKTLVMTFLALKDYTEGRKIISNYNLNIPHYEINKDFLEYLSLTQPSTEGFSFFLDELWLWIDSRSPMSNKVLTYMFLQSSKGDTRIYMTTQSESQIDLRIRDNAHIIIRCERKLLIHNKMRKVKNRIRNLGKDLYPYLYIKVKEFENHFNGLSRYVQSTVTYYLKANWVFKFYDTNQKMRSQNIEVKNENV